MTSPRILVSNIMMMRQKARIDSELRARGYEPTWADVVQYMGEEQCLSLVGEFDGWIAGNDRITRRVLEAARPRLKVISKWGTGLDSIDQRSAAEFGIQVFNSPGAFREAVAEVAIGLMLMLTRHLAATDRAVRAGDWPKPMGTELRGSTLGLIGYGAIGSRIGELGTAFGMNVIFHDPFKDGSRAFAEIASDADVVCVACALTSRSRHIVNEAFLSFMRPEAFLVNIARGALVDERALIAALQCGGIAGAALDVFDVEPLPIENPLREMNNVVLSSHNANNGAGAVEAVHINTLRNLDRGLVEQGIGS